MAAEFAAAFWSILLNTCMCSCWELASMCFDMLLHRLPSAG